MTHPYLDPARPVADRVADLMLRMTAQELVAQLCARYWGKTPGGQWAELDDALFAEAIPHGIGQVCQLGKRRSRAEAARVTNQVQRFLVQRTRLCIPALCHEESLHGMIANDVTCLPTPLTLAASWDPDLVEEGFAVVGDEMRRAGMHLGLSPVLDLLRDARWGRAAETFGEDPCLVSAMGVAAVRGLQGQSGGRLLATGKHFVGYGQSEGGHNAGPFTGGRFDLCHTHLRPWQAAIRDGGLAAVMPSYAAVEGQPCHGSRWVLRTLLRDRLGFSGITVADYGGVAEQVDLHGTASDAADAARQAILAGLDCELPNGECYEKHLVRLMTEDAAVEEAVKAAVSRVLAAKFRLGLFEHPWVDEGVAGEVASGADATAARLAEASVVLLANPGSVLPVDPAGLKRVAVIGPHSDGNLLGPYYGTPRHSVDHATGLREALGPGVEVVQARGCRITGPRREAAGELNLRDPGKDHSTARRSTPEDDADAIRSAVEMAKGSDLAILVLGDDFSTTRESFRATPCGDRADLGLWGGQMALVDAVRATGVPMVVVLNRMGVLAEPSLMDGSFPLIDAGCLGQDQGRAVARVITGQAEPGGRLSHTIPRSAGHLPGHLAHPSAARRGYGFDPNRPLFPFGFGLSYTTFALSDVSLGQERIGRGEPAEIVCTLSNTGRRRGTEVVQVYHQDRVASRTRPARELVGFRKVGLEPGESQTLHLEIPAERLGFTDEDFRPVQEPGAHRLWLTTGADPTGGAVLELTVV